MLRRWGVNKQRQDGSRYQAWLKRTRRRLAASGGLSQAAARLAIDTGDDPGCWRKRLESLLDGSLAPTIDIVTRIDSMLSNPSSKAADDHAQGVLFADDEQAGLQ
jgi:hypothetical protein